MYNENIKSYHIILTAGAVFFFIYICCKTTVSLRILNRKSDNHFRCEIIDYLLQIASICNIFEKFTKVFQKNTDMYNGFCKKGRLCHNI